MTHERAPAPDRAAEDELDAQRGRVQGAGLGLLLMGLLLACLVPLGLLAAGHGAATGGPAAMPPGGKVQWAAQVWHLGLNASSAALLLGLGVGLMRVRRWAVRVAQVGAPLALGAGIVVLAHLVWTLPGYLALAEQLRGRPLDPATRWVHLGWSLGMGTFQLLVLPAVYVAIFRSPAAFEAARAEDPRPSWTEACSPRVLGLAGLWALMGAIAFVSAGTGVTAPFGRGLPGPAGVALSFGLAAAAGALAYGLYRQRPLAWWGGLLFALLWGASSLVAALTLGPAELATLHASSGFTGEEIAYLERVGQLTTRSMRLAAGAALVLLVYQAAVWREFVARPRLVPRRPAR